MTSGKNKVLVGLLHENCYLGRYKHWSKKFDEEEVYWWETFSWWGDEQILGWWGTLISKENPVNPYLKVKKKNFRTLKISKTKPPSKYMDVKKTMKKYFLVRMKEAYGDALPFEPNLNLKTILKESWFLQMTTCGRC